tara:strand:+ start:463 stop:999 length:537 start_codon:yes stop_codon:yes gene_type:complete
MAILDEVTFINRLLSDNWASAASTLYSAGKLHSSISLPKIIDVRSIEPNEGRRVDADSDSAIVIIYEESSSTNYPTIDHTVRNEDFTFTIHIRVLARRDFANNTTARDRLQSLYRIVRYILENNSLKPTVYVGGGSSGTVEEDADIIKLTGRSEANDRKKRLLGYKLSVEMKRFARSV